ncbi:MAG: sodium:proton antiporter [Prevotella sp.]|nr:sodium:proton antiporter [Prevotella sp.]
MTLIIIVLLLLSYLLIATGHLTGVNKAAIAMFIAAAGWVVYICYGTDYVEARHIDDYWAFLKGVEPSSEQVKLYIYNNVFLNYVGKAAAIVMFLLATMSIVELLNNNGCFDFIQDWIRTRNSKRVLWTLSIATFIISANLDDLTTTTMMLVIMHKIVQNSRQRMVVGTCIVLAANCGGCMTVIGDPAGVVLWGNGAVTASRFSAYLALPVLMAWFLPTWWLSRILPERLDVAWPAAPYRGDDTNLNRWQRILMLVVGIGGLWFIPTFHSITKLSPFLGALCVLSVLWVVNEAMNRKLNNADQMSRRLIPRALQYDTIQQILFIMGIMLGLGVVTETGVFQSVAEWIDQNVHDIWMVGLFSGLLSSLVDTFTIAMSNFSLYPVLETATDAYQQNFVQNGAFWLVIAYSTAVGGCLLCVGNVSGLALMKMEHVSLGWYLKHCTLKIAAGWLVGMLILAGELYWTS